VDLDYSKVWSSMNDLETIMCKAVSVREVIDAAVVAIEHRDYEKAERLMNASYDFIGYFIDEFDDKFKIAWKETVTKLKHQEYDAAYKCDREDSSPECKSAWTSFWEENYYPEEYKKDKVKRWVLPVQEIENGDTMETEYFITFPDDLLEIADLKEGDGVEWVDQGDGSYLLKKIKKEFPTHEQLIKEGYKTYEEAVSDGWTMTADGFWIKE
jgi:bifunctional DNA-binding transcriptional regulator/antitoxin component of YhaV-PrlF toxin-antitoxin module